MIGSTEVLVIAAVIALLFGADALARVAREAGRVKREVSAVKEELEEAMR